MHLRLPAVNLQVFPGMAANAKPLSCKAMVSHACAPGFLSAMKECPRQIEKLVRNPTQESELVSTQ